MKAWSQRNRLGLILLPAALILALAGSSSRLDDYWWSLGLNQPQKADSSGVVHFSGEYDDGFLSYPINPDISLVDLEKVESIPGHGDNPRDEPVIVPTNAVLWKVVLRFDVDPDIVMTGCTIGLVDEDGTVFDSSGRKFDTRGDVGVYGCAPTDTPGPQTTFGSTDKPAVAEGEAPRPQVYDWTGFVVTTKNAKPTSVRVWWLLPRYAELPVPDQG